MVRKGCEKDRNHRADNESRERESQGAETIDYDTLIKSWRRPAKR